MVATLLLASACAQQSFPPGGPPRHTPPHLMAVTPDSGAVDMHAKAVSFIWDEVVAERPAGGGQSLADLILISPRDGLPRVDWHRTHFEVRGQKAWKPNTAYTVTLRPGVTDLHGNVSRNTVVVIFSTGATIPTTMIRGVVFDWSTGKPVTNALVQIFLPPDSTQYITLADSTGRFLLSTVPPGPVTVLGIADQNNNRALDPREAWDSAMINLRDSATVELYAFVHDTIGPRLSVVDVRDSMSLRVTFDKPLAVGSLVDTSNFTLRTLVDSQIVPLRLVRNWRAFEKERTDSAAHADSIAGKRDTAMIRRRTSDSALAAARDTTPKVPLPIAKRPLPATEFVIFTKKPLTVGTWYRLESHGVRNLLGDSTTSVRTVQVPKPTPPPVAKPVPTKTLGAPAKKDTMPPRPPKPPTPLPPLRP